MLGFLGRLLAPSPARKGRRLARDARAVVGMVRDPVRAEMAAQVGKLLAGNDEVGGDAVARDRWGRHLRGLHAEARRAQDQAGLTALTLAIIDLEARAVGAAADEARDVVAAFVRGGPA